MLEAIPCSRRRRSNLLEEGCCQGRYAFRSLCEGVGLVWVAFCFLFARGRLLLPPCLSGGALGPSVPTRSRFCSYRTRKSGGKSTTGRIRNQGNLHPVFVSQPPSHLFSRASKSLVPTRHEEAEPELQPRFICPNSRVQLKDRETCKATTDSRSNCSGLVLCKRQVCITKLTRLSTLTSFCCPPLVASTQFSHLLRTIT